MMGYARCAIDCAEYCDVIMDLCGIVVAIYRFVSNNDMGGTAGPNIAAVHQIITLRQVARIYEAKTPTDRGLTNQNLKLFLCREKLSRRQLSHLFRLPSERQHARLHAHCFQLRPVEVVARPREFFKVHVT